MSDTITLADIERVKALARCHPQESVMLDAARGYLIAVAADLFHDIKCAQARSDWRDYYRAVRTLRKIRLEDGARFKSFSKAWWQSHLRAEFEERYPHDGRFGWQRAPLADRLSWFKIREKAQL